MDVETHDIAVNNVDKIIIQSFQNMVNDEINLDDVIWNPNLQTLSSKIIYRRNLLTSKIRKAKLSLMFLNMVDICKHFISASDPESFSCTYCQWAYASLFCNSSQNNYEKFTRMYLQLIRELSNQSRSIQNVKWRPLYCSTERQKVVWCMDRHAHWANAHQLY